ncbi:dTDP-4-dehydrorhamnose 3,5-epimerase family protein [Candidatus Coxiella mudrowiae]|uniref:dTDP-4-dehydrorhamnose 3,5-epimerase family protein n=1 Tax=Candidatus Coxiella mudrowiae TaxID=2054173 RepID=UPI00352E094F
MFLESWQQKKFDDALLNGKPLNFVQDNHSKSAHNILRELHYQLHYPKGKLVRITARIVYDVIIDLR